MEFLSPAIDVNMPSDSGMGLVYMGLRQVWHWFICEFVLRSASLCPQIQAWKLVSIDVNMLSVSGMGLVYMGPGFSQA